MNESLGFKGCSFLCPVTVQRAASQSNADVESRSAGRRWMAGCCEWVSYLLPIAGAMGRELLAGSYIQADETPVDVQSKDKRGKNHQAYLWQYGQPGGSVVFDFRMGRAARGPNDF